MRRFRRFGSRRAKRSVSWIDGLNTYDNVAPTNARVVTLAALPGVANIWFASFALTTAADLTLHGGEDAVLVRTVGRLGFFAGRRDAGAGFANFGFQMRVVLAQVDVDPTSGLSGARIWTSSQALGSDDILHSRDVLVHGIPVGAAGAGYDAVGYNILHEDFDIRVKRKLQVDRLVTLVMQTVLPAGTTAADFVLLGGLRMLVQRPR